MITAMALVLFMRTNIVVNTRINVINVPKYKCTIHVRGAYIRRLYTNIYIYVYIYMYKLQRDILRNHHGERRISNSTMYEIPVLKCSAVELSATSKSRANYKVTLQV